MASYKGRNIPAGSTQAQITKIIRDADSASSGSSSSSRTPASSDVFRDPGSGRSGPTSSQSRGGVKSAPMGSLASGGTDPLQYGAAGRGEFLNDPKYAAESEALIKSGAPMSVGSDYRSYKTNAQTPPPIPQNPESVANSKERYNNFRMSIDETMNDPWITRQEKKDKKQAITTSFAGELGKGFNSVEEFAQSMQDQSFANMIKDYEKQGGDVAAITSSIGKPAVGQTQPQGAQSIEEYLGAITTPDQQRAFDSLIPEQKIAQDQISFEQSIPEQYRKEYFGTPDQIGFLEQQKNQKKEEIKLLERKAKLDEKNARAQVDYAIDKARAEVDIAETEVEQNRLQAKNYMTGMLAKLGALNTSSGAPIAIATLEQEYQQQKQVLRSDFNFAQRELEMKLTEEVDNIGLERDENILKVKSDISKSEEDAWKEIFKLQNEADKSTFKILGAYATDFRTQTDKYTKESKAAAERWAKKNAKAVSTYDISGARPYSITTKKDKNGKVASARVLNPDGTLGTIDQLLNSSRGEDGKANSQIYQNMFNQFIEAGGTESEFLSKYPPSRYANPNDPTLPDYLKPKTTASKSTTKSKVSDREA
jgi:hypothetical protein